MSYTQPYTLANLCLAAALLCHTRSRLALVNEEEGQEGQRRGSWLTALCWALDSIVFFTAATLSKAAALPSLVPTHYHGATHTSRFFS
jgi:hypothetical protein